MRLSRIVQSLSLAAALLGPCGSASAADDPFERKFAEAGRELALADPRVQALDDARRAKLASFVMGNLLFVLTHELGHAVISELKLPVLGREEDAADRFATLALLFVGTQHSRQVLLDAAHGLWTIAGLDKKSGRAAVMYGEHGLDMQRAYQIICLMVGADRRAFKGLATLAKMPEERQETCEPEYEQTVESWRSLLKARTPADAKAQGSLLERVLGWRRAAPEKPTSQVVDYAGAPDALTRYRGAVMAVGLLELIAGFVDANLPFTKPITLKAMGCGEQNAFWDNRDRQLVLCYELVSAYVGIALETPDLPPIR